MVNKEKSRGTVLIVVLVFCLLVGLIAKTSLESSTLQFKILHNYKKHQQGKAQADEALIKLEHLLESTIDNLPENIKFLQFVPDTLAYAESQGALYYALLSKPLDVNEAPIEINATFCVRKLKDEQDLTRLNPAALLQLRDKLNALNILDALEIKIKSGEFVYVVAYQGMNNQQSIALIEKFGGRLLREFKLSADLSSTLLAIDSNSLGFADRLVMGNRAGELLILDVDSTLSEQWEMKTIERLFQGNIIGTPIAGRHPQANGTLLYVLVEDSTKQYTLITIEHSAKETKTIFQSKNFPELGQPLLWQGFLLVPTANQLVIFEVKTGKIIGEYALQNHMPLKVPVEALLPPQVLLKQPLDLNPTVVVSSAYQLKFCSAPLLSQPLGRKTFAYGYPADTHN